MAIVSGGQGQSVCGITETRGDKQISFMHHFKSPVDGLLLLTFPPLLMDELTQ